LTDFDRHFHTSLQPLDSAGASLQPLDLVILGQIPNHYFADPAFQSLRLYEGGYGMISYFGGQPYYFDNKNHPGWVSGDGQFVNVRARRIHKDALFSYDFWVPPKSIRKIPMNVLIMSAFADFPLQMSDDDGPGDHPFVVRGMEQFEFVKRVLHSPYEDLVKAHDAAMAVLEQQ
jgi:hypothetical protein